MLNRLAASGGAAALLCLFGYSSSALAGKLTISTGAWVGYGALYLARDLGFFKQRGLEVEILQFDDTLASTAALMSAQTSGAALEIDVMMDARKKFCVKGVVTLDDSSGADGMLAANDIPDLAALKGKVIAVPEPGRPNVFLSYILNQAKLARSDVTILNMRPDDAAAAFIAGRVPVAVTYEPNLSFVTNAHKGKILFDSSQAPGLIADVIGMRCDVIEHQPDDVKALVQGVLKADDTIKTDPDKAYEIMRKYVGGFLETGADFGKAAKGVKYYDRAMNRDYLGTVAAPGKVMATIGIIDAAWGTAAPNYSYSEMYDPEFIDEDKAAP